MCVIHNYALLAFINAENKEGICHMPSFNIYVDGLSFNMESSIKNIQLLLFSQFDEVYRIA